MTRTEDALRLARIPVSRAEMLIHRPPPEVFQAVADPAVTTRFWFTRSSGTLTPGADVRWEWDMYGVSTAVSVKEVEENQRIRFEWGDDKPTVVELRFTPWADGGTYVEATETGFSGDGDEIVAHVGDSIGGFYIVLCALKAFLEHNIVLPLVRDAHPRRVPSA